MGSVGNPFYEEPAARRYNYARSADNKAVRLIFLKGAAKNPDNKTLMRKGRFIWCKNLRYEGTNDRGLREISFTIGKGKKRFTVDEAAVLCLPSGIFVNNNAFFRSYEKVFAGFSSVFCYDKAIRLMMKNSEERWKSIEEFGAYLQAAGPFKIGTLVEARIGYFMPARDELAKKVEQLAQLYCDVRCCHDKKTQLVNVLSHVHGLAIAPAVKELVADFFEWSSDDPNAAHPYGIILGKTRDNSAYSGRELYRVNFGGTIYEKVHPVQMEVINEV